MNCKWCSKKSQQSYCSNECRFWYEDFRNKFEYERDKPKRKLTDNEKEKYKRLATVLTTRKLNT